MSFNNRLKNVIAALEQIYTPGEAAAITQLLAEKLNILTAIPAVNSITPEALLDSWLQRLLQHEPVQYVLGEAWFYNNKYKVTPDVLIPRPETEELVHRIITDYRHEEPPVNIIDVGTGSGCIAITLQKKLPFAKLHACDISNKAIELARSNAEQCGANYINFIVTDFLNPASREQLPQADIIVSNPPYIPLADAHTLEPNVIQYEPHIALFADGPLIFYEALAGFAATHLKKNGAVYVELDSNHAPQVQQLFINHGYSAELIKDIFGNRRFMKAVDEKLAGNV